MLAALARLVISSEAKHVGQVFTKLSSSREASLSDTGHSGRIILIIDGIIAGIKYIILTIIEALGSVLGQHWWMRSWSSRYDVGVGDSS